MNHPFDTIAAVSTPAGKGGVALIRLSGNDALSIASRIFKTHHPCKWEKNRLYHGWIVDGEEPVDEVVVLCYLAPHSYTGEQVVEICCHGSPFISERILNLLFDCGAKPAEPGEFTQRAFLNGRIDLAQAEAVADLINAKTEASRRVAAYQLEGRLSDKINFIREELIESCGLLELELDFGEEEVLFASREELAKTIKNAQAAIQELLDSYQKGRVCREGFRVAIVGPPNAGKSSLLNCLVEKERAIVTDIPGTTRDTIDEMIDIDGVLFTITDTAGMRESLDPIEQEGVRRSRAAVDTADLVLWVTDGSRQQHKEKDTFFETITSRKKHILLINKSDLIKQKEKAGEQKESAETIHISALTGHGINKLIKALKVAAFSEEMPREGEIFITRARHANALKEAAAHIENARVSLRESQSQEFIAMDLRAAMVSLGEIIGKVTTDDILNKIFSDFCIGK